MDSIIARPTNKVRVMVLAASGCCASELKAVETARPSPSAGAMLPTPIVTPAVMIETIAIKRVFGDHAMKVAVSSTKSMTGHLLGGAGGLEAGISALALRDQIIPPTINQDVPDPQCDLDYVPNVARKATVDYALSNSFGFGGTNAALIFKRWAGK